MKSNFEQSGGSYIDAGYYFLPAVTLPENNDERSVGVWATDEKPTSRIIIVSFTTIS